jgi:hypothetical protein
MNGLEVNKINDGGKNVTINFSGVLVKDIDPSAPKMVVDFLSLHVKRIRLESITFAIEEKAGFYLWWMGEGYKKSLILPLESRGWFDFEKSGCLHSPEWAVGIGLSSFKIEVPKAFLIILDMGKQ